MVHCYGLSISLFTFLQLISKDSASDFQMYEFQLLLHLFSLLLFKF